MATQTEYVAPPTVTGNSAAVTAGTTSRTWMLPGGASLQETISGGGATARPVVQTNG